MFDVQKLISYKHLHRDDRWLNKMEAVKMGWRCHSREKNRALPDASLALKSICNVPALWREAIIQDNVRNPFFPDNALAPMFWLITDFFYQITPSPRGFQPGTVEPVAKGGFGTLCTEQTPPETERWWFEWILQFSTKQRDTVNRLTRSLYIFRREMCFANVFTFNVIFFFSFDEFVLLTYMILGT